MKLENSFRGKAMKTLTLLVFVLVVFALACKLGDSGLFGGSGGGNASNTASSAGADPKSDVVQASKKLVALPSFSAKMEGFGQMEIKQQVDFVAPDRFHVTYLAGAAPGMEIIAIGDQSWMKAAGGNWSKMPGGPNTATPNLRDSFTDEGLKTLTDVKFEGDGTVDAKPTFVYTYKNVTPKGSFPFSAKMWVDKQTGVPLQLVADYTNGVLKQMTVKYDTASPVSIEPPIK
ncbi:MAG TPA: hypothetical protein VNA17_02190 [Pyrinomonadaceae bacterium]|nr:hypothetical protein [Pyrinomonadaceae bacterium]